MPVSIIPSPLTATGAKPEPVFGATAPPHYLVKLPGWDDVIHLRPTATLSPYERKLRSDALVEQLKRSPTPHVAQEFARIATELDNIQDALVTLSVAGRVAVAFGVPIVGVARAVATAADVVNAINILYPNTLAAIGARVTAGAARAGAGRSKYVLSRESKRQLEQAMGWAPGTYRRRLEETLRTGRVGFGWGEALQVLQTSDWLFGAGISLGPVFGGMTDTMFGAVRGGEFDVSKVLSTPLRAGADFARTLSFLGHVAFDPLPNVESPIATAIDQWSADIAKGLERAARAVERRPVRVNFAGAIPIIEENLGLAGGTIERTIERYTTPLVGPATTAAEKVNAAIGMWKAGAAEAASSVWKAGKWLIGTRGDLPWDVHLEVAVAQYLAMAELAPYVEANPDAFDPAEAGALPAGEVPRGYGLDGRDVCAAELAAAMRDAHAPREQDWIEEIPDERVQVFAKKLISGHVDMLPGILEGPHARVAGRSTAAGRGLITMHDYDLLPPFSREDRELMAYAERLERLELEHEERGRPGYEAVRSAFIESFPGADGL